jgi:hypothetical protein
MSWPPILDDLKDDMKIVDTRDDDRLQVVLDAAIAFVQTVHDGRYDFTGDLVPLGPLPPPSSTIELGTIRLAGRWHIRRRSPDGLVQAGELGSTRVTSFDPDIDRQLKIGKYARAVIA